MTWFLIVTLAVTALLALLAVLGLIAYEYDEAECEQARIEREVRAAERRLHDIARASFQSMLEEARADRTVRGR
jgi:hypothetical protein